MTLIKLLEGAALPLFRDREGPRKIIIGVVVSIFPVVSFAALGYILDIFRYRLEGRKNGLPDWKDAGMIFSRGVVFFLALLSYFSLPVLFTSSSFSLLRMGFIFLPPAGVTLMISAALWLVAIYMMPMAIALFLRDGTIMSIFKLVRIYRGTLVVLRQYLQATIINLLFVALVSLPMLFNPLAYLLFLPITFVVMIYLASLYGEICIEVFPQR